MPAKPNLRLVTPVIKKRAVSPLRRPNSELRSREHLTQTEVEKLIEAAKANRYGHRDATMILVAYRHGLRASEVCDLRWEQIDWNSATLHVRRVKSGKPSTHPFAATSSRAAPAPREAAKSPFIFISERGGPFTTDSFNWLVKRAGRRPTWGFKSMRTCCAMPQLQACRRRSRYPVYSGLSGTQEYSAHRSLYGVVTDEVQEFLARLM